MNLIRKVADHLRTMNVRWLVIKGVIPKGNMYLSRFEIWAKPIKAASISIGRSSVLDCILVFERAGMGRITIGDRCHIGSGTKLISINSIRIGSDVTIAWGCTVYDHDSHSTEWDERKDDTLQEYFGYSKCANMINNKNWSVVKNAPIVIADKVWIGFGVTILKGVKIGEGAVIGAMSVITNDIPPYSVVAGNPARVVRQMSVGVRK